MRHDVFISFRGEDVRRTFLSHLIHSLEKKGIRSVTSASSYPSKSQAVKDSRVVIPVISKSSTSLELWLEELDKIIASEITQVPVFLRVDPQDVLIELDPVMVPEDTYEALEMVKYWLDHHVMSKSGFHSNDCEDDSQLVDQITCFVSAILTQDSGPRLSEDYLPWFPRLDWFVEETDALDSRLVSPVVNPVVSTVVSTVVSPLVKIEKHGTDLLGKTSSRLDLTDDELEMSRRKESDISLESLWPSETVNEPSWWDEVIRRIPFLHRSEPSETVNESSWWDEVIRRIPFLHRSEPSETVNVLPYLERFTTKMNTFAEHRIMAHHKEEVLSMLQQGDCTKEVRTVGIYGVEGVGKTTLSKSVYKEVSRQFHHRFYITNFSRKGKSLHEILSNETLNSTTSFSELVGRKVLLVADSVDDIKQLKDFVFEVNLFGPGSRVILITRDRSLLSQYGVKHIYNVTCPGYIHSIQIFSHFAFHQTDPVSGFERLAGRAIEVAGRIPLALKMLGTYLYGKEKDEWESTLLKLEESSNYVKAHALHYMIEPYASRSPIILEHEEDEPNRFPSYSFTLR